jgi:catechol 2,3-dioxygenase-like lactoylglutathione lyase family enzyme
MTRTTTRITSVSLQVADQDRALAFYTEILGCQLRADVDEVEQ